MGHDSPNRLACEIKREPNAAITKKVKSKVIVIASTLFIFIRTKNLTTGWSTVAIMIAKTIGIIILLAMYNIVIRVNMPTRKMVTFA